MRFELLQQDTASAARRGQLHTPHGTIQTPIFMPVGTQATVKAVHTRELTDDIQAQIILSNTYHLYLRPGCDIIQRAGGLHRFIGWQRPILTDSGGFQVFSLTDIRRLNTDGCEFRSHIDGSRHFFTPEKVVDIQRILGSDIIMPLDECTPGTADRAYATRSLQLTHNWLKRSWQHFQNTQPLYNHTQALFPIVQGCTFKDLRRLSATFATSFQADGYAIGGLAVGEETGVMYEMIETVNEILPTNRPRYLMGVGTPQNLLEAISRGVDMFDCVLPTRNGRNAMLFTMQGILNMRNKKWEDNFQPIDPTGTAYVDTAYNKAYLHHLFKAKEFLAAQIASIHNLAFYLELLRQARSHIEQGDFTPWARRLLPTLGQRL